jgi:hypothetical protein
MKFNYIRFFLILGTLIIFAVLILQPYFFLDEPNIVWEIKRGTVWSHYFLRFISEGRPLYGWIQLQLMTLAGSMHALWILRIISILLSVAFLFVIFNFLSQQQFNKTAAFVYTVMVFCLPGFSLFMLWSECFPQHLSSLLSFFAGVFTWKVFAWLLGEERISKGKENLYIFYALVLQIISLLNYQGTALVFILPGYFLLLLKSGVPSERRVRFLYYYLFTFFTSLALYYMIYKSMLAHHQLEMVARGKMGTDYLFKLKWFGEIWIKASTLHLFLFKPFLIQRFFTLFILFLLMRDAVKKRWMDLSFLFLFSVLSFLPHLLIGESWGATRNFVLMGMVILFYALMRSMELFSLLRKPQGILLAIPFPVLLFINSYFAFLKPVEEDYRYVYSKVQELPLIRQDSLVLQVKIPEYNLHDKHSFLRSYCDEFNVSPLHYEWPVAPSIKCFYQELHPEVPAEQIELLLKIRTKDTVRLTHANVYWDLNYQ